MRLKVWSIPEAARLCSVDRSTMHRWVLAGKIKSYTTAGGHKRILPEDLKQWIEDNQLPFDINEFESNKAKILIVDDEETVRNYLKIILKGIFIDIESATDGFDAGKKVIQYQPDLIILDLFMPTMDGFEVCKNIKADPATKKIKILILSGHGTEKNEKKAMALGADAFLKKPSSKNKILECVEILLKKRSNKMSCRSISKPLLKNK